MTKRVLVIEDDEIIRECLGAIIESEGMEFLGATDGRSGLDLSKAQLPDLIISDLHMAGFSGIDVLKGVRRDPDTAGLPFLVITADATESVRRRCLELGASGFLLKPFGPERFMDTVHTLLDRQPVS